MPFEERGSAARRVAVIGGGISGMGAAYHLAESAHVVLFEAEPRLGGHARTIVAGRNGDQPVGPTRRQDATQPRADLAPPGRIEQVR